MRGCPSANENVVGECSYRLSRDSQSTADRVGLNPPSCIQPVSSMQIDQRLLWAELWRLFEHAATRTTSAMQVFRQRRTRDQSRTWSERSSEVLRQLSTTTSIVCISYCGQTCTGTEHDTVAEDGCGILRLIESLIHTYHMTLALHE